MQLRSLNGFCVLIVLLVLSSCGVNRHIPKDEYLLEKNNLNLTSERQEPKRVFFKLFKVQHRQISSSEIKDIIGPKPNTKILFLKPRLQIYSLSSPTKKGFVNKLLRSIGTAPVLFSQDQVDMNVERIKLYLLSKGIFNPEVSYTLEDSGTKKRRVNYYVHTSKRYKIRQVSFTSSIEHIQNELNEWKKNSVLHPSHYYDQDVMVSERDNLINFFRNKGYYAFNKDLVYYRIDTNLQSFEMNIEMFVEPNLSNLDTTVKIDYFKKFAIEDIHVSINPSSSSKSDQVYTDTIRTTIYRKFDKKSNFYTFYYKDKLPIKAQVIDRSLFFDQKELFSLRKLEQSFMGLSSLQNFRFIDINFIPRQSVDDSIQKLDANIRLLMSKRHSFSSALELSNTFSSNLDQSVGSFGLEWNFAYRNKNLFRGGEILDVRNRLVVEFPRDVFRKEITHFRDYFFLFESGLDISLEIPHFVFPFFYNWFPRDFRPRTTMGVGYVYQYREAFDRVVLNSSFGYRWRGDVSNFHQLLPLEVNIIKINIKDQDFQNRLDTMRDVRLRYQYTDHLIFSTRYNYIYNGQKNSKQREFTYFSLGAESAGNTMYLLDNLLNTKRAENGMFERFGVPYSQYLRLQTDVRQYIATSTKSSLVLRFLGGIGVPYGNAISLPYEKSFFAGGTNNIRAWRMRGLGPGSFALETGNIFDRVGDMTLVANVETRFPLFSIIEGAFFLDAGNVWLLHDSPNFPNGQFHLNSFYNDIALGAGVGLRFNIFISIFRIDFSMPLHNPALLTNRWVFGHSKWSDIVINWGIGYPF